MPWCSALIGECDRDSAEPAPSLPEPLPVPLRPPLVLAPRRRSGDACARRRDPQPAAAPRWVLGPSSMSGTRRSAPSGSSARRQHPPAREVPTRRRGRPRRSGASSARYRTQHHRRPLLPLTGQRRRRFPGPRLAHGRRGPDRLEPAGEPSKPSTGSSAKLHFPANNRRRAADRELTESQGGTEAAPTKKAARWLPSRPRSPPQPPGITTTRTPKSLAAQRIPTQWAPSDSNRQPTD